MGAIEWFLLFIGALLYPMYFSWAVGKQIAPYIAKQNLKMEFLRRMARHSHLRMDEKFGEKVTDIHYSEREDG